MCYFLNIYELSKIILEEVICIEKIGVILVGGRNFRMGRDKVFLELYDKFFIEIVIEVFKNFDELIIIFNNEELYFKYDIKVYNDIVKDVGLIGGIYIVFEYVKYDIVIIVCDMLYLNN